MLDLFLSTYHQLEFEGLELGESDNSLEEGIELCATEMTTPFKPLMVKGLVQSIKDHKIVMNDGGFVPVKPPRYQSYSFDLIKAANIYEELVKARVILPDSTKKMPKPEELRGKKYCKVHYTFNHSIANCVQFRDWIQDFIVKGKLLLEKPKVNMIVDTYPFPEAPINMIKLNWVERGKGRAIMDEIGERRQAGRPREGVRRLPDRPQATVVKGVALCSKCQCECELEVPTLGAIIDRELFRRREMEEHDVRRSVLQAAETSKETTKNVFQRLGGDLESKGLSKVFRDFEASEEVEDVRFPCWMDIKTPQPTNHSSMRQ
ncbi:hypothetical protein ACFXTH_027787 [Malus domestica]